MPAHAADLINLGVDAATAAGLAARYSPTRVHEVTQAARSRARRNPAGWAIRALEGAWAVAGSHDAAVAAPLSRGWQRPLAPADDSDDAEQRWQAWDRALSAALDDEQLARAVALARSALPSASRVGPAVRTQLIRWAAQTLEDASPGDWCSVLHDALSTSQTQTLMRTPDTDLPVPP